MAGGVAREAMALPLSMLSPTQRTRVREEQVKLQLPLPLMLVPFLLLQMGNVQCVVVLPQPLQQMGNVQRVVAPLAMAMMT